MSSLVAVVEDGIHLDSAGTDSFYDSVSWARYQALDPDTTARTVRVFREDRLCAETAVFVVRRESNPQYVPTICDPELADHARAPTILVGSRRGYSQRLRLGVGGQSPEVLDLLIETVNEVAALEGATAAWWMYLDDEGAASMLQHDHVAGPWLLDGEGVITLPGDGFVDYLEELPRKSRQRVLADRRRFARSTSTVSSSRLSESIPVLAPAVAAHQRRHGHEVSTSDVLRLLQGQSAEMDDRSEVHTAFAGGEPLAAALTFHSETELVSRAFGSVGPDQWGAYFELCYYRPIESAYASAARQLHLGIGTLQTKVWRGAEVRLRWAVATGSRHLPTPDPGQQRARWSELSRQLTVPERALCPTSLETVVAQGWSRVPSP